MAIKDRSRLDDYYSRKARRENYPARSVWKLEEFDRRYRLLGKGRKVLDLGCAPGSWSLYAASRVGPGGLVLGLDLNPPDAAGFPGNVIVMGADLLAADPALAAPYGPFEVILSDMAPSTTGRREIDQARSLELCRTAWAWAGILLARGGDFLMKIFQSQEGEAFARELVPSFGNLVRLKPRATRSRSQEIFVLGRGFGGPSAPRLS
ncbi:MAG: RlmE family RNA methyltransferase [Deltaproteobacteria bacterium]|jgi:23S rRNA (uridine2552-2'-O)-methyltransferase|nr:RlmE family RNA methyltransferase [Deltaproteobacteria bacterium]